MPASPPLHARIASLRCAALLALVAAALACARANEPPRMLLLISVDTLRRDHLGSYGGPADRTPRLDALASESLRFETAYASAPLTLPSLSALHTGLPPDQIGIRVNESRVAPDVATLASELSRSGFRTAAVVSNFVLREKAGLANGFDVYDDRFPQAEAVRGWPERVAAATTDAAVREIETCAEAPRCFLWVHYQDPHGPYTPAQPLRDRELERERTQPDGARELAVDRDHRGLGSLPGYQFLPPRRDVAFYRAGYAAEVRSVDHEIGRLLDALERLGLASRTVVVFTADHGESLGEDGQWFAHGEFLSDAQVAVPLLMRIPGRAPARRSDVAALVDLRPTLLQLLAGIPASGPGRDLLASDAARASSVVLLSTLGAASVPRYGLVMGDYKLILTLRDGAWEPRLLRRGDEDTDLAAAEPQVLAELRERLMDLVAQAPQRAETRQSLSESERAALRALGYTESH